MCKRSFGENKTKQKKTLAEHLMGSVSMKLLSHKPKDTYLAWHTANSHVRAGCCALESFWLQKTDVLVGAERMSSPLDFLESWVGKQQPLTAFCRVRLGVKSVENLMRSTLKWFLILVPSWRFFVRRQTEAFILSENFCAKRIFNKN